MEAVFELGLKLFTAEKFPTLYRSWDEHELMQIFNTDEDTCLVAKSADRMVGFALGRVMEKPRSAWRYGWLEWLGVEPRYKRAGVATRLLSMPAFELFEGEFELCDRSVQLLGTATELHPTEFGNDELEVFDLGLLRADQRLAVRW